MELIKKVHLEQNFWMVLQILQILHLALCEKKSWVGFKAQGWGLQVGQKEDRQETERIDYREGYIRTCHLKAIGVSSW